jgi:hypothetical protein
MKPKTLKVIFITVGLLAVCWFAFTRYQVYTVRKKQVDFFVRMEACKDQQCWDFVNAVSDRGANSESVKKLLKYTRFILPGSEGPDNASFLGSYSIGALSTLPGRLDGEAKKEIDSFCLEVLKKDTGFAEWELPVIAALKISRKNSVETFRELSSKYSKDSRLEVSNEAKRN